MPTVVMSLSMPSDLRDDAARDAQRLGESLSTWIRAAMREKLEREGAGR